jgi:hypothetical protein
VGRRAILSRIITRFPEGTRFVIAVGHQADQIRDYLRLAHPQATVELVKVDRISGPGSGPGYSLLKCRERLNAPFYLVCGDTLWQSALDPAWEEQDWLGVAPVPSGASAAAYCNLRRKGPQGAVELRDKAAVEGPGWKAFIGLAHIRRHLEFFASLAEANPGASGELQLSGGFAGLVASGLDLHDIDWCDVGTEARYEATQQRYGALESCKIGEAVYIEGERVVKFFADPRIASARIARAAAREGIYPAIQAAAGSFFSYRYIAGSTLAESGPAEWSRFLEWCVEMLWKRKINGSSSPGAFKAACRRAYARTTRIRLEMLQRRHPEISGRLKLASASIARAIERAAAGARPAYIHGDLQPENVIVRQESGEFALIDWRQDVGGSADVGDIHWDLAKFYVWLDRAGGTGMDAFERFIRDHGFELAQVRCVAGLALLRMSGLHRSPADLRFLERGLELIGEAPARSRAA